MEKIIINNINLSDQDKERIAKGIKNSDELLIELFYSSDFSNTSIIRNFVSFFCDQLGIDPVWRFKIMLIADELNNNAIEYGSLFGDTNIMRIGFKKDGGGNNIFIEVEDKGTGKYHKNAEGMMEIKQQKLSNGFKDYSSIRGRGLFLIIAKLVDDLYFKDSDVNGGLIVGIKKYI